MKRALFLLLAFIFPHALCAQSLSLHIEEVSNELPLGYSHGLGLELELAQIKALNFGILLAYWQNQEKLETQRIDTTRINYGLKSLYTLPIDFFHFHPFAAFSFGLEEIEQNLVGIKKTARYSGYYVQASIGINYLHFDRWHPYFELANDWGLYQATHAILGLRYQI